MPAPSTTSWKPPRSPSVGGACRRAVRVIRRTLLRSVLRSPCVERQRCVDGAGHDRPDTARMDSPDQRVIILRAWREPGGIRVRVLSDGSQWVVGSVTGAVELVGVLLTELAPRTDD